MIGNSRWLPISTEQEGLETWVYRTRPKNEPMDLKSLQPFKAKRALGQIERSFSPSLFTMGFISSLTAWRTASSMDCCWMYPTSASLIRVW